MLAFDRINFWVTVYDVEFYFADTVSQSLLARELCYAIIASTLSSYTTHPSLFFFVLTTQPVAVIVVLEFITQNACS